ncbi:hypothetical protein D0809_10345 [Flavobacterium circumlabens]|uniref:Uncharacterized protein n=1 Tax=Flavobacterium circumlabens TaxID=2133765 RepID=A0A4Y7UCP8_9FLAO|nr:hypothetical protein [Flavobacterium circumlabens]TCN58740.1 hypothetical protein EV142_103180 [Flavobacterium circumlabens]TEB44156.1 hypothetical protein D0809_10345 [Flavobacterium circumlabens]
MELEKLQQEKIDGILFKKKIDEEVENHFTKRYKDLNIAGLTKSFLIDFQEFKNLILSKTKKNCKFYYTEKNSLLSLGLSFSDNEGCEIIYDTTNSDSDVLYTLQGDVFIEQDITGIVGDFDKGLGYKLYNHTRSKDTLIFYTLDEIEAYIEEMERLYPTITSLRFTMIQYSSTNPENEILADFTDRNNRIAFSVHALYNKSNNLYDESIGYDLGNLRP